MSVGLVVVSHSTKIAEGIVELAGQMADGVAIVAAGGTDDGRIGTDFDRVQEAIAQADSGDGAVVLCDLGSAVLTAETALDFLDDEQRERVLIVDAPVVEGSVAAAVAAKVGGGLAEVAAAAQSASGAEPEPQLAQSASSSGEAGAEASLSRTVALVNPSGLHARPAAEFVKAANEFDAAVTVNGVDAKSLLRIMALGLTKGAELRIEATGPDARRALDALDALVASGFGEL